MRYKLWGYLCLLVVVSRPKKKKKWWYLDVKFIYLSVGEVPEICVDLRERDSINIGSYLSYVTRESVFMLYTFWYFSSPKFCLFMKIPMV